MAMLHFDTKSFDEALKNNKVVVADFFATWCGPCKALGPVFEDLAKDMGGKAVFGKVDVDECTDLAERFEIMSVPTVLVLVNGEVKEVSMGFRQKAQLASLVEKHL